LKPIAAHLYYVIFANDKPIAAFLIKGHPVASAVEIFFPGGSKLIADKAGCGFLGPSVVALHHYGTSRVEKSFLPRPGKFSTFRIDGDQIGVSTSFPDRNGRRLLG